MAVHSFFDEKRTSDPAKFHLHHTVIMIHEKKMKCGIILMTVSVSAFSKTSVEAVCEVLGT